MLLISPQIKAAPTASAVLEKMPSCHTRILINAVANYRRNTYAGIMLNIVKYVCWYYVKYCYYTYADIMLNIVKYVFWYNFKYY